MIRKKKLCCLYFFGRSSFAPCVSGQSWHTGTSDKIKSKCPIPYRLQASGFRDGLILHKCERVTHTNIHIHTHVHIHMYTYTKTYTYTVTFTHQKKLFIKSSKYTHSISPNGGRQKGFSRFFKEVYYQKTVTKIWNWPASWRAGDLNRCLKLIFTLIKWRNNWDTPWIITN